MRRPDETDECLVEAQNLTKRFPLGQSFFRRSSVTRYETAVDDVSLRLHEGEIFGLVGPNGAGKTTLIKMLTTLLTPTSGSATIDGLDIVKDEYRVRKVVGLVTSNERSFYWRLTGRQNLYFFASLYELRRREARPWIDELLDILDLQDKADERFEGYSTGTKQRFAFARGLLCKPRFLFMDEPTKGVDPIASSELIEVVGERIAERWNPTMLITSHNLSEIERLCGRIALMKQGRIAALGSLEELRTLARSVERFQLRVRNVAEERLRAIASSAMALYAPELVSSNGTTEVVLEFPLGSDGFARFVRDLVQDGGDLLTCTTVKDSFDRVFHTLVTDEAEDGR